MIINTWIIQPFSNRFLCGVYIYTYIYKIQTGYGFLSENHKFVRSLNEIGITFIGPGESAMSDLGDKIQSKIIAKKSGVNTIPGFDGVVKNTEHALEIGYYNN